MIRLLTIPVAGTIAALIAISITRTPREGSDYPLPDPRTNIERRYQNAREAAEEAKRRPPEEPGPEEEEEAAEPDAPDPPEAPEPAPKFVISVDAEGKFRDADSGETYASADAVAKALPQRARIVLYNLNGDVTEEQLGAAAESLREHFEQVQTAYDKPD